MPDKRTRRNADTRARLEEQRLARNGQQRPNVVEAVVNDHSLALPEGMFARPFGSFEAVIDNGRPDEVGDLVLWLLDISDKHAPKLVGRALIRMEATLAHGELGQWRRVYWPRSEREARNYVRYARGESDVLHPKNVPRYRKTRDQLSSDISVQEVVQDVPEDARPVDAEEHHCEYEQRLINCARIYKAMRKELEDGLKGTKTQLALLACINRALDIKQVDTM